MKEVELSLLGSCELWPLYANDTTDLTFFPLLFPCPGSGGCFFILYMACHQVWGHFIDQDWKAALFFHYKGSTVHLHERYPLWTRHPKVMVLFGECLSFERKIKQRVLKDLKRKPQIAIWRKYKSVWPADLTNVNHRGWGMARTPPWWVYGFSFFRN